MPKRPYINFGELECRRVGYRRVELLASWIVGELVCRRLGCWRVGLLASCPVIAQLNRQPTEIIYILAAKWRFAWTSLIPMRVRIELHTRVTVRV